MAEYIEKDVVLDLIDEYACEDKIYLADLYKCIAGLIKEIVDPVVQSKWIDRTEEEGEGYWKCSNCEEPWVLIEGTPAENKMNYCPSCGAKMED